LANLRARPARTARDNAAALEAVEKTSSGGELRLLTRKNLSIKGLNGNFLRFKPVAAQIFSS
jgi:hypothetical protein